MMMTTIKMMMMVMMTKTTTTKIKIITMIIQCVAFLLLPLSYYINFSARDIKEFQALTDKLKFLKKSSFNIKLIILYQFIVCIFVVVILALVAAV
jgi:hypothetical protein